ncbi:glutamine amidotransferase [Actinoplanes lobatus]|uniref:Glutamine amidotransferase n=1 Tax=Actinoplanes lobatus TaxID=113568 RepID=A0A7W7HIR6_9ACTN|nr:DJ-1/PfpI family protein [Actinoplanes lobatus]MBB4751287.1 putative intracellular protease/amidase [Actinoplanes lobatus]GGN63305.1 glutamine amidotransferase [Actinoplanes lobatus]GIE44771.1 glutamine amidotransferase [Actinoplanes lobatus]
MLAQIVLFDGFDPLDVIAPYEALVAGGIPRVELVSAGGPRAVPSGIGPLTLNATAHLDPERADLVVVPGAAAAALDEIPAVLARALETPLPGMLAVVLNRPGAITATVCGGSLLLAMAGLITGRPATTHQFGLDALTAAGAVAIDARIVEDGDLVTASSVTSGLDLGLYLLERTLGAPSAHAVERLFHHERRGTVWRPAPAAAQPVIR